MENNDREGLIPDQFGLRKFDFKNRSPEKSEIFSDREARTYIEGCDYPESSDDLLLAWEIAQHFPNLKSMKVLDAMCGPGRLGRELLQLGAKAVSFHDGHNVMLNHALTGASLVASQQQGVEGILSPVDRIDAPSDSFDLVVCHNSTHQLTNTKRLHEALKEFVRVTKPGGHVVIADYQRGTSPEFMKALENRLEETKKEIVPLLIPTFTAAFSKQEFTQAAQSIPGIQEVSVEDATLPAMTRRMSQRVKADPVKGHVMDFSPISLRVIIKK